MARYQNVIDEQIANRTFQNAYLLYGDEKYLLRSYKKKLLNAVTSPDDNMNFTTFDGPKTSLGEVIDLAETLPFFAEYRVILLTDTGFFHGANEELTNYLAAVPEQTILIFVESKVDGRTKTYKQIKKYGCVMEFKHPDDAMIERWALSYLKREKISITRDAWSEFLDRCPEDMDCMEMELKKLASFAADTKIINKSDVEALITKTTESKVYDMVDAALAKDIHKALLLYHDLLANKEPPIMLMTPFLQKLDQLYLFKSLTASGLSNAEIASRTKQRDWIVRNGLNTCRKLSAKQLQELLVAASDTHYLATTGGMDPQLAIETLLVTIYNK